MNTRIPFALIHRFVEDNLLDYANRVDIQPTYAEFSFWQGDCDSETLRQAKRVFGPMRVVESSWGDKYLMGEYHPDGEEYYFKATIYGAYVCEIVDQKIVEEVMGEHEIESKRKEVKKLLKQIESGTKEKVITTRKCRPA